jgi:protein SCO1/2
MATRTAILLTVPVLLLVAAAGLRWPAPMASARTAGAVRNASSLIAHFPNVRLRTQENRDVRFYDDLIKGKVVLLNFMFTSCTTLCPRSTENLVKVQQALGDHAGRDVFMVSISVDPQTDTPAVLKEYGERFHTKPGWTFVTGKAADIDLLQRQLGVFDNDEGKAQHTGMLIYGSEATGSWAAMPIMLTPTSVARNVLRLVED